MSVTCRFVQQTETTRTDMFPTSISRLEYHDQHEKGMKILRIAKRTRTDEGVEDSYECIVYHENCKFDGCGGEADFNKAWKLFQDNCIIEVWFCLFTAILRVTAFV